VLCLPSSRAPRDLHSFPTRRSSDLNGFAELHLESTWSRGAWCEIAQLVNHLGVIVQSGRLQYGSGWTAAKTFPGIHSFNLERKRSEEHTSELQSRFDLVCRLLLEKK